MRSESATRLVFLFLACVGLPACTVEPRPQAASAQVPTNTPRTSATTPQTFDQYATEIRSRLYQEKYTSLDTTASQLRDKKDRFPGGSWKLNALYTGLGQPPSGDNATDEEWQIHLGKLRNWAGQVPDSVTARIGLANALVNYAWDARGQGYADSVTNEGWRLFEARAELAEKALNDAQKLEAKCPHWYVSMLRIGLGHGWEPARFNKIFEEGVALEPTYYYLYRVKAMYLMPRWHGEAGDWERFADETKRRVGGKEGAILYYLIASHIRSYYGKSFFEKNQISWPKMKEGFDGLEQVYGANMEKLNEACMLAAMADDRATARSLFDRIGENWDASIWRSKTNFDVYRAWANHPLKS